MKGNKRKEEKRACLIDPVCGIVENGLRPPISPVSNCLACSWRVALADFDLIIPFMVAVIHLNGTNKKG